MTHSWITGLDVADAPAFSGGGPQSVPSRISVVLVDEANAGALHDGSVHVMIRTYGRWLAWRSRLV